MIVNSKRAWSRSDLPVLKVDSASMLPIRAGVLLVLVAAAGALFARRARLLYRLIRLGRPVERRGAFPRRVEREVVEVLGQRKLFQRLLPGTMHAFIFWGFLILSTTIVEALGQAVDRGFAIPVIGHTGWLGMVQDVFAALVIAGIGIAVWIRVGKRPERFVGSHRLEAFRILGLIFWIMVTLFGLNATRIASGLAESPTAWTPLSTALSHVFSPMSPGAREFFVWLFLWTHLLLILGFLVYLGYSKHLHIVTSAINVFFGNTRPRGTLTPLRIDLDALESEDLSLGAATVTDLSWKQLLDLYACTECGRCQSACPAWTTGKPLSPKLLIMDLRDHLLDEGPAILRSKGSGADREAVPLVPDVVDEEVVWACTTCGACMQECPVDIEHIDHIVDLRRNLVMAESRFPQEAGQLLRNLENAGNPWGLPQSQRATWAEGLGVRVLQPDEPAPDYLYWVGCAGSFDDRAKAISRSVVALLQRAGIDFAILGEREGCSGDPGRRMGNEYLFQTMAERNIEVLAESGVRKIVANCPHCFNTLRNEYSDYGGVFEVIHHTQLLARLVAQGRLRPSEDVDALLAYHDPCYLGRHNGVYEGPRKLLEAVPALRTVELPRHRSRGLCCGAGGARMWMEERIGKRINAERMDEAASTGADTIGVACPYCLVMLDDGAKERGDVTEILDIAQVIERSLGRPLAQ